MGVIHEIDVDNFFGMRLCICGGDFEMVWWESLAYLLGLWSVLFIGLVFVLAMDEAIDWILSMEVDFLGGVWMKQLPTARTVAGVLC